jgi:hypothetical protein
MKYTQKQLDEALTLISSELTEMLKADGLAKGAKDDAPAEESSGSAPPADPAGGDGDADDAPPAAPPEASEAPPAAAAEGEAPPDAPPGPPEGEGGAPDDGGGQAWTVEQLTEQYSQLPPEELKKHFLACKAALMQIMGQDQGQPPPAPEASAPPPPAGPPAGGAPMAMSEKKTPEKKLQKSESDVKVEALEKQLEAQSAELLKLVKVVEVMTSPVRKSIKGVSDLKFIERTATPEKPSPAQSLTKAEVTSILREKVREGKLTKSEKDLVAKYTVGAVDVSKIEHLLVAK